MDNMQPGQLIVPHDPKDQKPVAAEAPVAQPATPPPANNVPASPTVDVQPITHQVGATAIAGGDEQPTSNWQRQQEYPAATDQNQQTDELQWTASEFIAHDKSPLWYGMLGLAAIVLAAVVYFLTKDKISTSIVLLVAILFAVFAGRKPNTLRYSLSYDGLQIGPKFYSFQDFKAFSVGQDGAVANIVLMPLKRFMPPLTLYIAPDIADQALDFIANFLPFEQHKSDAIDGLLKRIRF